MNLLIITTLFVSYGAQGPTIALAQSARLDPGANPLLAAERLSEAPTPKPTPKPRAAMRGCAGPKVTFEINGQTNNHIINIVNMLVFSQAMNYTLYMPASVSPILRHFNTSAMKNKFCIAETPLPHAIRVNSSISFYRRHEVFSTVPDSTFRSAILLLTRNPGPHILSALRPYCSVTAAVHLRNYPQCEARCRRKHAPPDMCDPTDEFIERSLTNCSLSDFFLASDHGLPDAEKRIAKRFQARQYAHADSKIAVQIAVLVDLMVLSIAASRDCALLNPVSSFTGNALSMRGNVEHWCAHKSLDDAHAGD
jgi:hypothetical protein